MRTAILRTLTVASILCHAVGLATSSARGAEGPKALALSTQEPDKSKGSANAKLLVRELARQAVLISARDELGLSTRDMTLRETVPDSPTELVLPLDLQVTETSRKSVRVRVSKRGAGDDKPIFDKGVLFGAPLPEGVFDYRTYVAGLEKYSRGEIVEALKPLGLQGGPLKRNDAVKMPAAAEKRLRQVNFLSQLAVARELHELEREAGQSPETLGGLVRAYANLGQLTYFHWNAAHKAFMARALLYAQRLVAQDPQNAHALRHRAYAETMAGMHALALEDLQAARQAAPPDSPAPPWEKLIEGLCRYDHAAFSGVPPGEVRQLAALLSFLVVEGTHVESQSLLAGRKSIEQVPECYMICDAMGRFGGVSNRHLTTISGPTTLRQNLPRRLRELPGLSEEIANLAKGAAAQPVEALIDPVFAGSASRRELISRLVEAGAVGKDQAEPSLEMVGRLIEDVTFVHIYRRLEFLRWNLGWPGEGFRSQFDAALAMLAGYPLRPVLECVMIDSSRDAEKFRRKWNSMPLQDVGIAMYQVSDHWGKFKLSGDTEKSETISQQLWTQVVNHTDHIVPDFEQTGYYTSAPRVLGPKRLRIVSPHSPQAVAMLISKDPSVTAEQVQKWLREFAPHAVVWRAAAIRYDQLKLVEDSQRALQEYLQRSPDQWGYDSLAKIYRSQNQTAKWKETLEKSLSLEDFALSHAKTRVTLARYHMGRKEYDEALPYADAAAETGAAWAMICAAECYEALEQWDEADEFWRSTAERYAGQQYLWYFACRRTGHGDVETAGQLAAQYAANMPRNADQKDWDQVGVFHLLTAKHKPALDAFRKSYGMAGAPYSGVHLALLCSEAGDIQTRDATLAAIAEQGEKAREAKKPFDQPSTDFARWMATDALALPDDAEPDTAALDELLKPLPAEAVANLNYFAGRFFLLHGELDLARRYLQRAVETRERVRFNYTLACALLRELGGEPAAAADGANDEPN